ncbi:MAG: TetR/AcrR family transcriptional regulator [Deltaproteobacteria bacterium]|nr:TetR/AcrR family transcriptional regulator [Deltaproteobacteria bacterium]
MQNIELKEKRTEDIFEAALQCFNETGYAATAMKSIAAKAHISKGGMYHYFGSKRELFLNLFRYRVNKYFNEMKSYMKKEDTPEQRIRTLVRKAGQILKRNEDFYKFCLEFLSQGTRDAEIRKIMTAFYKDCIGTFRDLVEEGIEMGNFKETDSKKAARAIYFLVMGVYFTYFSIDPDFDVTEQHSFHVDNILQTMKNGK